MNRGLWFILAAAAAGVQVCGHNVVTNPDPAIVIIGGKDPTLSVVHFTGEGCVVTASASATSKLASVTTATGTGLDVVFTIHPLRQPTDGLSELVYVSGTWKATGQNILTGASSDPSCAGSGEISILMLFEATNVISQTGITTGNQPNATNTGDPVSTSTTEITARAQDLFLGGLPALTFQRYYGSELFSSNVNSALGSNWMHNFDVRLRVNGSAATVVLFGGKTVQFQRAGSALAGSRY